MREIYFESIDSTNTYLKNNYESLDDMTFVRADIQTKGRGRNDRVWKADKGDNLLFSILIKDREMIDRYKALSVNSAYIVLKVLESYGIDNLSIKWPNDIYVNDRKICGILLEAVSRNDIECLIIGIGINVNQKEFVGEYITDPTSMYLELHEEIDLNEFKEKVFASLNNNLREDYYEEIKEYDYLKNKEADVMLGNEKKHIRVLGINDDYSLKISDGTRETDISSGEISFHI